MEIVRLEKSPDYHSNARKITDDVSYDFYKDHQVPSINVTMGKYQHIQSMDLLMQAREVETRWYPVRKIVVIHLFTVPTYDIEVDYSDHLNRSWYAKFKRYTFDAWNIPLDYLDHGFFLVNLFYPQKYVSSIVIKLQGNLKREALDIRANYPKWDPELYRRTEIYFSDTSPSNAISA